MSNKNFLGLEVLDLRILGNVLRTPELDIVVPIAEDRSPNVVKMKVAVGSNLRTQVRSMYLKHWTSSRLTCPSIPVIHGKREHG